MEASVVQWITMAIWFLNFLSAFLEKIPENSTYSSVPVRLHRRNQNRLVMDNGLVQVTLSNPAGNVVRIQYSGMENVLENNNGGSNRGYWDVVWNKPGHHINFDKLRGTNCTVIMEDENQVEVSFTKTWNLHAQGRSVPINVDKRLIMKKGSSGFYMYAILERQEGWPDIDLDQIRIVFKLNSDKFHFMAVSDDRQRVMPISNDRLYGKRLAYPEAVKLTNPRNRKFRGEVDDKYQYSCENGENRVHGWISEKPPVGFWMITPSDEFRAGGPIKQDLTSHVGPTVLSMFTSTHYTGKDLNTKNRNGESWKKVFGPVFVYLNSLSAKEHYLKLWEDAKDQMWIEVKSWPYNFPHSQDFPNAYQRGTVSGQLLVHDRYISDKLMQASSAYVGLAAPGNAGSWQTDSKGYQFWTQANQEGYFSIKNVRAGDYNLYAWVPGFIGDWKHDVIVTIQPGSKKNLGVLVYEPPRNGPTLWEIGIPDRKAAEFFVPEAYPSLINKLYTNYSTHKFRQYGLWERYTDLYQKNDLIYNVGTSNYHQDWFFAHVPRKIGKRTYKATTWQIVFRLEDVSQTGNYTLQLALASAHASDLQVRFNDRRRRKPHFSTGLIGKDNAVARHGIHGLYRLYNFQVPSCLLKKGTNTIFLTQSRDTSPFRGIMYDYIRLEGISAIPLTS